MWDLFLRNKGCPFDQRPLNNRIRSSRQRNASPSAHFLTGPVTLFYRQRPGWVQTWARRDATRTRSSTVCFSPYCGTSSAVFPALRWTVGWDYTAERFANTLLITHADAACHSANGAWTLIYTCSYVIMSSSQQTHARARAHALTRSWCTWQSVKRMCDHIARVIINTHIRWAKELLVIKSKAIWMKRSSRGQELACVAVCVSVCVCRLWYCHRKQRGKDRKHQEQQTFKDISG